MPPKKAVASGSKPRPKVAVVARVQTTTVAATPTAGRSTLKPSRPIGPPDARRASQNRRTSGKVLRML